MEENQNGMYGDGAPRTYGEESKMYGQQGYGQPNQQGNYEQQAGQPNEQQAGQGYGQPNQQGNYQQPYGQPNQQGNYQQQAGQPNQQGNYQQGYGQTNQQGSYQQQAGQQYGQPNYNPQSAYQSYNQQGYQNGYWNPQPQHGPVTDVFCYILLVIMPLRVIISMITTGMSISSLDYSAMNDYSSLILGISEMMDGTYMLLSNLSNLLFVAFIVLVIVDIVKIHKANYKITGLILFAIFLNPGYYIWRAYVLGRKKTVPVLYTVVYSILVLANIFYTLYMSFNMAFGMMQSMY